MKRNWRGFARGACWLGVLACVAAPLWATEITPDQVMLTKMMAKYASHRQLSYQTAGKMIITAKGMLVTITFNTTARLAAPNLCRISSQVGFMGRQFEGVLACNGLKVWEFDPQSLQYSEAMVLPEGTAKLFTNDYFMDRAGMDFALLFYLQVMDKKLFDVPTGDIGLEVRDFPTQEVDGKAYYVIKIPVPEAKTQDGYVTVYLDPQDLLIRRSHMKISTPSGNEGEPPLEVDFTVDYANIQSEPANPADFEYAPPLGAAQVEALPPVFKRAFKK